MRTFVKVLIVLFITGVLLLVGVVGIGVYWWKTHKGEYIEAAKGAAEEGVRFGRGLDNQACVDAALSRHKQNPGFGTSIKLGLFLQGCLQASSETPGFCTDVPEESEIMKTVTWRLAQCQKAGFNDSYCQQIVSQVQKYCHPKEKK